MPIRGASGEFDSGIIMRGGFSLIIFNKIGTFDNYCSLHPWMTSQVIDLCSNNL